MLRIEFRQARFATLVLKFAFLRILIEFHFDVRREPESQLRK